MINDIRITHDLSVLVVDDSKTSAIYFKQQLKIIGVCDDNITLCFDYQSAIEIITIKYFDVIFIDYHLEQGVTGNELNYILSESNLIGEDTAIILISGDSSKELISTIISSDVRYFIKKPISPTILKSNLKRYISYKNSWKQLERILLEKSSDKNKVKKIREVINDDLTIAIESKLISTLIKGEKISLLSLYLNNSNTSEHMTKTCALAHVLKLEERYHDAIELLEKHIRKNPLSFQAVDELVNLLIEMNRLKQAFVYSERMFRLTPSINHRLISASFLAMSLQENDKLIEFGLTYANKFSSINCEWKKAIILYFDCLLSLFNKDKCLSWLQGFVERVCNIMSHQINNDEMKKELDLIKKITIVKQLYRCGEYGTSHRAFLSTLSSCQYNFTGLSYYTINQMLMLSDEFAETWSSKCLLNVLVKKYEINKDDLELQGIVETQHTNNTREKLLKKMECLNDNDLLFTFDQLSNLIHEYPFCTEVKLLHYRAKILLNISDHTETFEQIKAKLNWSDLPLPWQEWLIGIQKSGAATPLPDLSVLSESLSVKIR